MATRLRRSWRRRALALDRRNYRLRESSVNQRVRWRTDDRERESSRKRSRKGRERVFFPPIRSDSRRYLSRRRRPPSSSSLPSPSRTTEIVAFLSHGQRAEISLIVRYITTERARSRARSGFRGIRRRRSGTRRHRLFPRPLHPATVSADLRSYLSYVSPRLLFVVTIGFPFVRDVEEVIRKYEYRGARSRGTLSISARRAFFFFFFLLFSSFFSYS